MQRDLPLEKIGEPFCVLRSDEDTTQVRALITGSSEEVKNELFRWQ